MVLQCIQAARIFLHILIGIVLLVATGSLWNNKSRLVKATKQWWLSKTTALIGFEVTVKGTAPTRTKNKGILFVSNHISWTDIPLIGGLQRLNFLSKAEVRSWPLVGRLAQGTGTLFIQRGKGDTERVAENIASYIDEGRSVLFFPEGTTSDGKSVKRFHPKLFGAAKYTDIHVCPIAIHYSVEGATDNPAAFIDDDEFTSHLWNLLRYRKIKATVEFLPIREIPSVDLNTFTRQLRNEISNAVALLNSTDTNNVEINTNARWLDASNHADR